VDEHLQTVAQIKTVALDMALKFGPRLAVGILIVVAGVLAGRWAGSMLARLLEPLELEVPVRQLLVRIMRLLVLGLFGVMALQNLGVELLPLIAGLGVAGAGVALAMQGVLSNLVAGLTIIFTRPFRVGEYISIVGEEGRVEEIALFKTILSHTDRSRVVIPNRKIVGEILHNYGNVRQLDLSVGVAYDTDVQRAIALVSEILKANPRVLGHMEPVIGVSVLADSSVNIAVKPWTTVDDFAAAGAEINQAILERFRRDGIAIPFPQREVRLLPSV
jgi:small conductance mechanosensitive channel